jgi:hypothetical protein
MCAKVNQAGATGSALRTARSASRTALRTRSTWPTRGTPAGRYGTGTAPTTTRPSPVTSGPAARSATSPIPKTSG